MMGRIGSFQRTADRTLADAPDNGDILAAWVNDEGVTVKVTVKEYPHKQMTWEGSVRVAEYWVSVEGSEDMDGAGPESPFDGLHSTTAGAKDAARDVMREISGADGERDG